MQNPYLQTASRRRGESFPTPERAGVCEAAERKTNKICARRRAPSRRSRPRGARSLRLVGDSLSSPTCATADLRRGRRGAAALWPWNRRLQPRVFRGAERNSSTARRAAKGVRLKGQRADGQPPVLDVLEHFNYHRGPCTRADSSSLKIRPETRRKFAAERPNKQGPKSRSSLSEPHAQRRGVQTDSCPPRVGAEFGRLRRSAALDPFGRRVEKKLRLLVFFFCKRNENRLCLSEESRRSVLRGSNGVSRNEGAAGSRRMRADLRSF